MVEPTRIGRYRILDLIGRGTLGSTYHARDEEHGRDVAIKVLHPTANAGAAAYFRREGQVLARLRHPNVVVLHDVGGQDAASYLVFELLRGVDLGQAIRRGIPPGYSIPLVLDVLAGLAYLHEEGIVHHDIKPANIFAQHDASAKIIGFEIATRIREPAGSAVAGTPDYMSPELARGEALDGRSDLFAVGGVLYELLVGHPPFRSTTIANTIYKVQQEGPDWAQIPTELERLSRVVRRSLEKRREDRYSDAAAMSADLSEAIVELRPASTGREPNSFQNG